ncbi:MAG: tRNA-binding protein [Bacteroidales bacterium]|jgi:tRNA-binding protein|nr:tRNA-binding protein [Bacteroidales bacterium]
MEKQSDTITWDDFAKIDMRVGTIVSAEIFGEARKPAYKITVDFGELGQRKSSAQITKLYVPDDLIGRQVICVVNFPKKQIATLMSECLIMGVVDGDVVTLLSPERKVGNGLKIG